MLRRSKQAMVLRNKHNHVKIGVKRQASGRGIEQGNR